MLGRADVARERMATDDGSSKQEQCIRGCNCQSSVQPHIQCWHEGIEQAEALAGHALELSEKHQLAIHGAAFADAFWVKRERTWARGAEGIALIRKGIAGLLEVGNTPLGITAFTDVSWQRHRSATAP